MSSQAYLVNLVAADQGSAKVWNFRKPLVIGHPGRWSLEKTENGVRFRSLGDDAGDPSKDQILKDSEIAKNASIVLVPAARGQKEFRVELSPMVTFAAAANENSEAGSRVRVFYCKGEWSVDSEELKSKYVGIYESKKVFVVRGNATGAYVSTDTIQFKALTDGLKLNGTDVAKGTTRVISYAELRGLSIQYKTSEWKLSQFNAASNPLVDVAPVGVDSETQLLRKSFGAVMAAFCLIFLISWIIPSTPVEEKKDEPVRILLAKKKTVKGLMTAAPKGDKNSRDFSIGKNGSAKNPGKKGGERSEKRVAAKKSSGSPARSTPKKQIAQSKAPKKSAPAKSSAPRVAKQTRPSVNPVPVQHSDLYKTFSSASFKRASSGLVAGGVNLGKVASGDTAADARQMGNSRGNGSGGFGKAGGVSTNGARVSGFGGGGAGDGGAGNSAGYGRGSNSKVSGQGRSLVSLDTSASDVDEGLTRDQVGRVIHAHMNEIRYCYDSAILRDPDIEGKMNADFSIGPQGVVSTARSGSSSVSDRRLQDCILARLKQWKFPKPKGGVTVAVSYPFMFKALVR